MRNRGRLRQAGRRLVRHGVHPRHLILSITDNGGGFARVTTRFPHGLPASGGSVWISGANPAAYNGVLVILDPAVSATAFDLELEYVSDGAGGVWRLA